MKKTYFVLAVVIIIIIGAYYYFQSSPTPVDNGGQTATTTDQTTDQTADLNKPEVVIGKSAGGRDIMAYNFGSGTTSLLFIGGIHGGYEWNTSLVAYKLMDYLKANPNVIPGNEKITIIPVLNPDGLIKVVGTSSRFTAADVSADKEVVVSGRFNGNNVDLNRNFDCDWQTTGKWQDKTVSGGSASFSEPESLALKNFVETIKPTAVVVWYSSAGGVFSSNCHDGILPETSVLTKTFSSASGYRAFEEFNFYEITGDMVNWLAKINVPAISVLLTNHTDTEWTKNQAGAEAILKLYAK